MNRLKAAIYTIKYGIKHRKEYKELTKEFNQELFDKIMYQYGVGLLKNLGINLQIEQQVKLPQKALYISNHNSMYDSIFTFMTVKERQTYFIAGEFENLEKAPIIGNIMRWTKSIFVNRISIKDAIRTVKLGEQNLNGKHNLIIFPEGELSHLVRNKNQDFVGDFHYGSFKPAIKAKVPIVPLTIIGSDAIHQSSKAYTKVNKGTVKVYVGNPITDHIENDITSSELADLTRNEIIKTYHNNK